MVTLAAEAAMRGGLIALGAFAGTFLTLLALSLLLAYRDRMIRRRRRRLRRMIYTDEQGATLVDRCPRCGTYVAVTGPERVLHDEVHLLEDRLRRMFNTSHHGGGTNP